MGHLFIYILNWAICLALLYLPYCFLLRKDTFHAFNRFALLTIVVLSALLPLFDVGWLALPMEQIQLAPIGKLSRQMQEVTLPTIVVQSSDHAPLSIWVWVCLVYSLGLGICLMRKTAGFLHFYHTRRKGCLWTDQEEGVTIYCHADDTAPYSWMRNIVISEKDYRENGREILLHEKAHIRLCHSWDMLLLMLAQCFQWFNPFIWMLGNDLQDIHEYQADLAVIRHRDTNARQYQLLIIKKAVGNNAPYAFINSFNHSLLKKRITMMLKQKSSPWATVKYMYLLPAAAICLMACSQSANQKSEESANPEKVVTITKSDWVRENAPLYIVDGNITSGEEMTKLDTETITGMTVLTDSAATARYGEQGKHGAMLITTNNPNKIYEIVDQMPEFPGGMNALIKYLRENLQYPKEAQKKGTQGRVAVQFVVEKDGSIGEVGIIRPVDPELDKEAARVISTMPKWTPGSNKGEPVRVKYTVPVMFQLK